MASAVSTEKIFANAKIAMYDHDPGATTAVIVSGDGGTTKRYVDGRDAENFAVVAMLSLGSAITKLEIVASSDVAFTSPVVVKDSGAVAADAVGDYVALECTAAEVAPLGTDLRYLAGRLTQTTATDEAVVTYIQTGLRFAKTGSTATTIA